MFGPRRSDFDTDEEFRAAYEEERREALNFNKRWMLKQTSAGRFQIRLEDFKKKYKTFPRTRHAFWWVVHNIIAHIGIGLMPIKATFWFHDYTSDRLNLKEDK